MRIGYARVSTKEQSFDVQVDALNQAGCDEIYRDVCSGARAERPALGELLSHIRGGDVVVIWKLDRLGRSLKHLVELVNELNAKDVGLQSLQDPIDTTTPQGRLCFNVFASLAEFERDLIQERTQAGLASARARGRKGGRPKGLSPEAEATACAAETLYLEGKLSVREIAKRLGISKNTLYVYLRHRGVQIGAYHSTKRSITRMREQISPETSS
jgi:DNA invertase Pin-like site-specific DNA recombinase